MLDPKQLEALSAVVDSGGFDKAARKLFLTQSAISQRIRQLEENLGQPVLTRTSPPAPTTAGRLLLQHFRQLSLMEGELLNTLLPDGEQSDFTTLAVGVNADSLATWFLPAVQALMQRRRLLFDVMMDDQDYTHELMRSGHVAGCIGTRDTPIQGGECHFLGCMRYLCLATPDFATRYFADGFTHAALAQAPAIIFSGKDDLHSQFLRQVAGYDGSTPHITLPTPQGFVQATRLGLAYSLLPELMIDDDLESGRLLDLLPGQYVDLPLYWHHWRVESSLAGDLSTALLGWAQQVLRQQLPER
ncbi:ArgP/LysG family DNA-binding transcriptional regulator [Aquitalea sp. FJL05]|uniref:LysR family transcriptional regulator ArgP n=1 Tax=Aquitalea TaxID=407217 RepID=UPI000F59AEE0|nr:MULTISPECIES: LysR family transcriptional regulator ArgP [Aquitalea]RQO78206.1 ArgP/LysG family DNA-binding transcriptional regulator [Aquitalea sp. FJL05]